MSKETILIVDDEEAIRTFLRISLRGSGYQTLEAESGAEAMEMVRTSQPDALVLDMVLPDLSGLEVTRALRRWTWVPIVFLSVQDNEQIKVEALDAGADDYLCKPFGLDELLARLRAALRRKRVIPTEGTITFGLLELNQDTRQVSLAGQRVNLTPNELAILQVLLRNPEKLLSHSQILVEVWGSVYADEHHMLRVNMSNLRKKLEAAEPSCRYLVNEPGIGYRLTC
ncbi:MAG: response regulator transcription factor [Candidatus Eremiobacteraeota bacterium]|nr:response regulator transcription factor [Candidatus Eremiobacteraeota bacterium]